MPLKGKIRRLEFLKLIQQEFALNILKVKTTKLPDHYCMAKMCWCYWKSILKFLPTNSLHSIQIHLYTSSTCFSKKNRKKNIPYIPYLTLLFCHEILRFNFVPKSKQIKVRMLKNLYLSNSRPIADRLMEIRL